MNADIKPIIDQIKNQIKSQLTEANIEQLKQQVSQGLEIGKQIGKQIVGEKAKPIMNDYIIPFIESESTSKAIDMVNEKFKLQDNHLMTKFIKFRQDLIESKVEKAKPIEVKEEA